MTFSFKKTAVALIILLLQSTPIYANQTQAKSFDATILSQDTVSLSSDILNQHFFPKKTVSVFLDAPISFVNNETVRKLVPEKANLLFEGTDILVLPFEQSMSALRTYKEDNRMIVNEYYSTPLNREDLRKITDETGSNYALFIKVTNSSPRVNAILFTITYETTVICDIRLLNIATNKYIISKEIVKDGSSTSIAILGMPDFNNAYIEALKKSLEEMLADKSNIMTQLKQNNLTNTVE